MSVLSKAKNYLKASLKDFSFLLRSIPAITISLFVASVIMMNLLANKTIIQLDWIALDAGILVSWLSFMCMDVITKRFGPKASTKISIFAIGVNLLACGVFKIASIIPSTADDYSVFDTIFGGTWFILLGSTVAFIASAVINNFLNWSIGKMFKKDPDGKLAYVTRTYISTAVGQFCDNLIFALIVFVGFAPVFWDGFCWTVPQCIVCAVTGALVELVMEIIFSPIGYKVVKRWSREDVGKAYLDSKINE